jgi:hypothetical protein
MLPRGLEPGPRQCFHEAPEPLAEAEPLLSDRFPRARPSYEKASKTTRLPSLQLLFVEDKMTHLSCNQLPELADRYEELTNEINNVKYFKSLEDGPEDRFAYNPMLSRDLAARPVAEFNLKTARANCLTDTAQSIQDKLPSALPQFSASVAAALAMAWVGILD